MTSATAWLPGRMYRMAVRGLRCRVFAMISWSGTPCSPRWVAAELVQSQPVCWPNSTRARS